MRAETAKVLAVIAPSTINQRATKKQLPETLSERVGPIAMPAGEQRDLVIGLCLRTTDNGVLPRHVLKDALQQPRPHCSAEGLGRWHHGGVLLAFPAAEQSQ